jgi:hypothetical protein
MPDFTRVGKTSRFSIVASLPAIAFVLFNNRIEAPLEISCLVTYIFMFLTITSHLITLLISANKTITSKQVICTVLYLQLSTLFSIILTIVFSFPAVRIFSCCLYNLDFLNDVTSNIDMNCENQSCSFSTISIWLPLGSFIVCALLSYQQIYNIYHYLHEKKSEHDQYDRLLTTPVAPDESVSPDVAGPQDVEVASGA